MRASWFWSLAAFLIAALMMNAVARSAEKAVRVTRSERVFLDSMRALIPPLASSYHKGEMGRIGIVGGSEDYTGAPYYAGEASLKLGGDLSFVFCSSSAAIPIKSYSPELMVTPFYDDARDISKESPSDIAATVIDFFPRLHTLVIGPGLGRSPRVLDAIGLIIEAAKRDEIPLVLDADALYFLSSGSPGSFDLIRGHKACILTPNKVEFGRLVEALESKWKALDPIDQLVALSDNLQGPTILVKGERDLVSGFDPNESPSSRVYEVEERGSLRRCGGQGDILAGMLGTALHWGTNFQVEVDACRTFKNPPVVASILASLVTKRASELAFLDQNRSMTTPDLLPKISQALSEIEHE